MEEPPSGLPQLGGPSALPVNVEQYDDAQQYEPATPVGQLPAFAPPTPADPHLVSQYSATLPATNAPAYATGSNEDTVPIPSAASVAAQHSATPATATAPVAAQYSATPITATAPVAAQYSATPVTATTPVAAPYDAAPEAAQYNAAPVTAAPVGAPYSASVSATAQVPGQQNAPAYAPATGNAAPASANAPVAGHGTAHVPSQYSAAPMPASPTSHYGQQHPTAADPTHTPEFAASAPQYAPANAQQFTTPPPPPYAATTPYAPPVYGTPSPYAYGNLPYQAAFPGQTPAVPASGVLSIVAIVLAAFAIVISFFVSPLVPAAGAVVCASIGLRRGERLAKLALILGIVATVYALGILALNVIALVLL